MKRTAIKRVSSKRAIQNRQYLKRRALFLLEHPFCGWWLKEMGCTEAQAEQGNGIIQFVTETDQGVRVITWRACPRSDQIHHRKGRTGEMLLNEEFWLAVSQLGHDTIHKYPLESYEKGYMVKRS